MSDAAIPQLESPGAGLPKIQLFIVKRMFPLLCLFTSREKARRVFKVELAKIRRLATQCSPEEASKRILIKRIRGIEDSSRYWSVYMTLHHLVIVNDAFTQMIPVLSSGEKIDREIRIEDVKPDPTTGSEIVDALNKSAQMYLEQTDLIDSFEKSAKHRHPWFGPLTAEQFYILAAMHMGIHRRQIELIIEGL